MAFGDNLLEESEKAIEPEYSRLIDKAAELFAKTEDLLLSDSPNRARCQMRIATTLRLRYRATGNLTDLEQSLALYAIAEQLLISDPLDRARCQMHWATTLRLQFRAVGGIGKLDKALQLYEKAETILISDPTEKARCQMHRATTLRVRYEADTNTSDLETALSLYAKLDSVFPDGSIDQATLLMNHALGYQHRHRTWGNLQDLDRAIQLYDQAVNTFYPGSPDQARCRMNWAIAQRIRYSTLGNLVDLDQALQLYEKAAASFPEPSASRSRCHMNRAVSLHYRYKITGQLSDLKEALLLFEQATEGLGIVGQSVSQARCQWNWAGSLSEYVLASHEMDWIPQVNNLFREAEEGLEDESVDQASCRMDWARALFEQYLQDHKIAVLQESLGLFSRANQNLLDESVAKASCQASWAWGLVERYKLSRDDDDLKTAVTLLSSAESIVRSADVKLLLQQVLMRLGSVYLIQKKYDKTQRLLAEAIDLLEVEIINLPESSYQLNLLLRDGEAYQHVIQAEIELGNTEAAWQYAERSRARLTNQFIQRSAHRSLPNYGLRIERKKALKTIAKLRRNIFEHHSASQSSTAFLRSIPLSPKARKALNIQQQTQLQNVLGQLNDAYAQLRDLDPRLAALQEVHTPDLAIVQDKLRQIRDGVLLIETFVLPEQLLLFILDGLTLQVTSVALSQEELADHTEAFHVHLRHFLNDGNSQHLVRFGQTLDQELAWFGERLWPGLDPYMPISSSINRVPHLIVVPSGPLHLWPLSALPIPGTREVLLDRYAISFLPSADSLVWLAQYESPFQASALEPYVGFAPVTSPHLDFAPPQISYGQATLGGRVIEPRQASFAAFSQVQSRVLALGTHAAINLDDPELSWIQMTGPEGMPERVSALEFLVGLDHRVAHLLVLLACSVHGARPAAGDNWVGLSQALLGAAHSIITSLWPINDLVSLLLTVPLWNALQAELTFPQALRTAIQSLREADILQIEAWGEQIRCIDRGDG